MTLGPGTRIGPYLIDGALDAGGMGEVYLATDTRLSRRVAIKILPPAVAERSTRRARFSREAQAASRLSHPHICAVHDVGDHEGLPFLVMEHLEGETLARRLRRGPMPVGDAVRIGAEIASALEHAHGRGITHRDLKPANVMLTRTGAKLLDFGLARLDAPPNDAPSVTGDVAAAPPTESLTKEGVIVGTARYMSPEQLEGCATDGRSDLFALGATLYEMVAGEPAFGGSSRAGVIAAVLDRTPPPVAAGHDPHSAWMMPRLNEILVRCLAKRPEDRWQTASELKEALTALAHRTDVPVRRSTASAGPGRVRRGAWIAAGALLLLTLVTTAVVSRHRSEAAPDIWFEVAPPDHVTLNPAAAFLALSPDGTHLAFVASSREGGRALWLRRRDAVTARQLPATEEAAQPFWSPDGRFIGFWADGALKTIDILTNVVRTLTDGHYTTGTWNRAGVILLAPAPSDRRLATTTVHRISADGGPATPVTALDLSRGESAHTHPVFLPDGRRFLFIARNGDPRLDGMLSVASIDSDRIQPLFQVDSHAVYSDGHLLFVRKNRLFAQRFDLRSLTTNGEPVVIADGVDSSDLARRGAFTVSATGVLAYRAIGHQRLAWFDRSGRVQAVLGDPARYRNPVLSPDGRHVAVERGDPKLGQSDIWIVDVESGVASRFTHEGAEKPLWDAGSNRIIFRLRRVLGPFVSRAVRGDAADETVLADRDPFENPVDVLSDGRGLLYTSSVGSPASSDLWVVPLVGEHMPAPVTSTPFAEIDGRVSPDGRWLAYVSNEGGPYDVYVRPFPSGAGKWRISSGGGIEPVWRRDGAELFYLAADRWLMSVQVTTAADFSASAPVRLFQTRLSTVVNAATRNQYVVSGDGQRMLVCEPAGPPSTITVIVNWPARLARDSL